MKRLKAYFDGFLTYLGAFVALVGFRIAGLDLDLVKTAFGHVVDAQAQMNAAAAEGVFVCDVCSRPLVPPFYTITITRQVGGQVFRTCSRKHAANILVEDLVGQS